MTSPLRIWLGLLALAAFPLLGAAPVSDALAVPVVVVYPLTSTGATAAQAGSTISILIATKLAQLGGLTVKPYTPGTQRPQFLEAARQENADYYVTGFMSAVGTDVSLITQVVSTSSGSVVYSTTTMASTYADAAAQADYLRGAILRHAGRGLPPLEAPPASASSSPAPNSSDAAGFNITKGLRHRHHNSPNPSPSPSARSSGSPAASPAP